MTMRTRIAALGFTILLGAALLSFAASTQARGGADPKVVQLSYYEDREDGRRYNLHAHAKRTEALAFSIRRAGHRIVAEARLNERLSDTDLRGEARHPWVPKRDRAGGRLIKTVADKLHANGKVRVRIRAKGDGGVDDVRVRILLSECSTDPPLYPDPDCEVKP